MTTTTFLPTASIQELVFVKFSSTVSTFGTELAAAFPGVTLQVNADTTSGSTSNALVILNENVAYSVPPTAWFGRNAAGQWQVWADAKMVGGVNSAYTPLPFAG